MNKTSALTLTLLAAALLAGCATPTPQQAQNAESARTEAQRLLAGFAVAMQTKDAGQLQGLMAPSMTASQFLPLALRLQAASWLKSYSGYTLEAGPVLDRVNWRRWDGGQVRLTVPATNADGDRFENTFVLSRARAGWYIEEFTVDQPQPGDAVDPPADVVEQIRPMVQQTMEELREGRTADIWYSLPEDRNARYRMPVLSFWQRMSLSGDPTPISLFSDLDVVKRLQITIWPDTSQPLELTWVGSGEVAAVYELPYVGSSAAEPQTLRVEMVFRNSDKGWTFYTVRFYGAAIPYSE